MSFVQFGSNFFSNDNEKEFGNLLFGPLDEEKKWTLFRYSMNRMGTQRL